MWPRTQSQSSASGSRPFSARRERMQEMRRRQRNSPAVCAARPFCPSDSFRRPPGFAPKLRQRDRAAVLREEFPSNSAAFSFAAGAPVSDPACSELRVGPEAGAPRFSKTGSHSSRQSANGIEQPFAPFVRFRRGELCNLPARASRRHRAGFGRNDAGAAAWRGWVGRRRCRKSGSDFGRRRKDPSARRNASCNSSSSVSSASRRASPSSSTASCGSRPSS